MFLRYGLSLVITLPSYNYISLFVSFHLCPLLLLNSNNDSCQIINYLGKFSFCFESSIINYLGKVFELSHIYRFDYWCVEYGEDIQSFEKGGCSVSRIPIREARGNK